jgi:CAAX protease family protein
VHQIGALALTLLAIRSVSTRRFADWGLNLRHAGLGIAMAAGFAVVVSVPTYFLMDAAPPPTTPITPWIIIAVLTTHFLVIGTTQEVLYRGFVMGFLENRWPTVYRVAGIEIPVRGLIAAVIFMLSHVKPFPPFVWPMQLMFSLVYGVLYALMYQRTRSLLGPSLAHGYSNAAYVAMMLLKYS